MKGLLGSYLDARNEARTLKVLERIANALDRAYPEPEPEPEPTALPNGEKREALPPLGILTADNETTAAFEAEEDEAIKSKEEKLMKEYEEYLEWRRRNVR